MYYIQKKGDVCMADILLWVCVGLGGAAILFVGSYVLYIKSKYKKKNKINAKQGNQARNIRR